MDRVQRTINVAKALNHYNQGILAEYVLINEVCSYFDFMKDQVLYPADKEFLVFLSNKTGIPHYYDMLKNYKNENDLRFFEEEINLNTFSSIYYEASLYTDEDSKLHKFQKEVLNNFQVGLKNRYFLSASTSFGKTHLTYEIIKKMKYKNVILIFPTIALLTENLSKLKEKKNYIHFKQNYAIHTLSEGKEAYPERNIFIFTPERFLSFLDKNDKNVKIDFVFVDEVYKIDNDYVDNDELEIKEHDRDVAYRMAIFYALENYKKVDLLLAGPYITFSQKDSISYNNSFDLFLENYDIHLIDKNNYEIVNKSLSSVSGKSIQNIDGKPVSFIEDGQNLKNKFLRLKIILLDLLKANRRNEVKTIIYCNTKVSTEKVANHIIGWNITSESDSYEFKIFLNHLEKTYHNDWCVIKALKRDIGIHHGVVPKYIQKEIINLFNNDDGIIILACTTTITEGVNTSAKNLIALFDTKGIKKLKVFDAKNIAGRAGRFMEHYKGVVISIQNKFEKILNSEEEGIKHKNFDKNVVKEGVDLEMTEDDFLSKNEKEKREKIQKLQIEKGIPEDIIRQFKAISREDKMLIYDRINDLEDFDHYQINELIKKVQKKQIDFNGFKVFVSVILPVVKDKNFIFLLKDLIRKDADGVVVKDEYPRITYLLYHYLKDGFKGLFEHRLKSENVDAAMRKTSELIFNTFKYQLVKYLGVFNLMYKYHLSVAQKKTFEDVLGLDMLLMKLEYNAFSEKAKIASDYGVPQKIIDYYDNDSDRKKMSIIASFDDYEKNVFEKTKKLFE